MKPLYSVIVIIFHRTPELVAMAKDCVASIKNSSKDYELIIVDNASTVRDPYWEQHADTYIRFSENRGISPAWNAGVKAARGQYIVVCNDDILVHTGWLEGLKEAMDQPQAGVANVYVEHLPQGAGIVEGYKWFSGSCFMITPQTIETVRKWDRRNLFTTDGYFDERFFPCNFEDHDYWTRVMRAGLKLYTNYGISIQHKEGQTLHEKSLSATFLTNKERFLDKWGFDNQEVFCGDKTFPFN